MLVSGEEIDLTRTEFDLLAHLVSNPGVVVPREELLRAVWATDFVPDSTHVVDVHLANLRRKLRGGRARQRVDPHHPRCRLPLRPLLQLTESGRRQRADSRRVAPRAPRTVIVALISATAPNTAAASSASTTSRTGEIAATRAGVVASSA